MTQLQPRQSQMLSPRVAVQSEASLSAELRQPSTSPQLLHDSPLVRRGLARIEGAQLKITDAGIDRFGQIIQASRGRGSERRNAAWTGKLIFDLAHLVGTALERDGSLPPAKLLYRQFFRMGHRISPGQFNYGLGIFAGCGDAVQVHAKLESHKSHGAWWASLSPEEKELHITRRQEAQRRFWDRLSPPEREARKLAAREALAAELAKSKGEAERAKYFKAEDISLALKAIERGLTAGTTVRFDGLLDPMRSSWEALFARVVASRKDRFYIYEPMGFPLIDPRSGRIETYHPDFLDYKSRGGRNIVRVVEIKGLLTPTGRRKIELFEKYYLKGDFSDVPEERRELLAKLVATAKAHARTQFQLDLDEHTSFRVFGEHYWKRDARNFVVHNSKGDATSTAARGLIPRLAKRFPEFIPTERAPAFSKSELKRGLEKLGLGQETLCAVAPIHAVKVQRSLEVPLTSYTLTRLYALISIVHEAQCACVEKGHLTMPDTNPLTTTFNMAPLFDMVTTWHGADAAQRKKLLELFANRLKSPQDYLSVYFGNIYLKLIARSLYEGTMFTFPERHASEAMLFETLRKNAVEILQRLGPLETEGDKKLCRKGANMSQINELKRCAVTSAETLLNSFPERYERGEIALDIPYISEQFLDLLKAGYPSVVYIYPTRGSSCAGELQLQQLAIQPTEELLRGSQRLLLEHRTKYGPTAR